MSIWFKAIDLSELNARSAHTLADFLSIQFTHISEDALTATMPADARSKQPLGIVHGGANVVLAETVASTAANCVVNPADYYCVGLEINANHIRSVQQGLITATARALHLGRTTQVWHIDLYTESGQLSCVSRMTAAVLTKKQ